MRCMACSQENCGRLHPSCTCSCHGEAPKTLRQVLNKARQDGQDEGQRARREAAEVAMKEAKRQQAQQEVLRAEANKWFRNQLPELIKQVEMEATVVGRRKVYLPALYVPFAKEQGLKVSESSGLSWEDCVSTDYILYLDDMFTDPRP